jgi:hypothetical protein
MIRKTFIPAREPHSKRNFCGYCGTHLTHWSERPEEEADYLNVTVGSLFGEDLRALEELGFLPDDVDDNTDTETRPGAILAQGTNTEQIARREDTLQRTIRRGVQGDMTWMEEMIDGSRLGMLQKTNRGAGKSADGKTSVEWEITEIVDNGSEQESGAGRGKRKLGDVVSGGDALMQP